MAKQFEEIEAQQAPDAQEVFPKATLKAFSRYVEEHISLSAQIKALEEDKKKLGDRIMNILIGAGQRKVVYDGRPVQIVEGSHSKIDKMKLLEAGVSPIVIRDSTVTTTYQYPLIGKPKNGGRS